jgi:hypothetical protein
MDEAGARTALERLAAEAPPPSRVDIGLAQRQGRGRLRWRRAGVPGASALAVVAIIGVFAGGLIPAGPRSSGPPRPAASRPGGPAGPLAAPAAFNPLIPYAAFGWLPPAHVFQTGGTSPAVDYLTAGRKSVTDLSLSVYSAGRCNLSAAQVLQQLQQSGRAGLNCGTSDGGTYLPITTAAGTVDGQPAFWTKGYLAWPYARGGWATLEGALARPDMLKVAGAVRFGPRVMPAIAFPVQLTGVLATWRLHAADGSVAFMPYRGVLRANQWYLSHGKAEAMISEYVDPAPGNGHCPAPNRTVGGYRVNVSSNPAVRGNPPGQQLCAHADGLSVDIVINGWTVPNVGGVFAHDTRLLGPDPANWTTRPLG